MKIKPMVRGFTAPIYGTDGSAGFDIPNANLHDVRINDDTGVVSAPLGFCAAIPDGYVGLIMPRSSAGKHYGVELINTTGVIDSDFRDEWQVKFTFKRGEIHDILTQRSLFQCVIVPYHRVEMTVTDNLDDTDRKGGWGSTDG